MTRARRMTAGRLAPLVVVLLFAVTAEASVLCGRRRRDGKLNGLVRVRQTCDPSEVTLTPDMVGFCCTVTTTTTSTTASTTTPCPTSTTLGVADCGGMPPSCGGLCPDSQTCGDDGNGHCACMGPLHCGGDDHFCGGDCPGGQSCQQLPVPSGCGSIGCGCCSIDACDPGLPPPCCSGTCIPVGQGGRCSGDPSACPGGCPDGQVCLQGTCCLPAGAFPCGAGAPCCSGFCNLSLSPPTCDR